MGPRVRRHGGAARGHDAYPVGREALPEGHAVPLRLHHEPDLPRGRPEHGVARGIAAHHGPVARLPLAGVFRPYLHPLQLARPERRKHVAFRQGDAALAAVFVLRVGQAPAREGHEAIPIVVAHGAGARRGLAEAPAPQPLQTRRGQRLGALAQPFPAALGPGGRGGRGVPPGKGRQGGTLPFRAAPAGRRRARRLGRVCGEEGREALPRAFRIAANGAENVRQIAEMVAAVADGAVPLRIVPAGAGRPLVVPGAGDAEPPAGAPVVVHRHQLPHYPFAGRRTQRFKRNGHVFSSLLGMSWFQKCRIRVLFQQYRHVI